MITLTELQNKEVVMMSNGRRLGYIDDLEIDEKIGKITALILLERNRGVNLFNKAMERMITWEQIITIGDEDRKSVVEGKKVDRGGRRRSKQRTKKRKNKCSG